MMVLRLPSYVMVVTILLTAAVVTSEDVTMATKKEDCRGDADNYLKYTKLEPSKLRYAEPRINTVTATFGMGCFWGVEASFGAQPGVVRVKAGYTGGTLEKPNYRKIGDHTEAVEVEFDPTQTNFANLLEVFWADHDPTELNKPQYMSAIFYHDDAQRRLAETTLQAEQKKRGEMKVVTKILPAGRFYDAEDYHQKYFLRQQFQLVESLGLLDADFLSSSRTSRLLGYMSGPGTLEAFNAEVSGLALSPQQADYMRALINSKDGGTCHS